MEKKRRIAVVCVGVSELAIAQADSVLEIKNTYKDISPLIDKYYDTPKVNRHPASLFKKGGKKQKNRYPNKRR